MPSVPYDYLISIVNAVRVRIGDDLDSLLPLGGQIGGNSQAYSQQLVNNAWRKLQQYLASEGYARLTIPNYILSGVPPVISEDTALQVTLDWTGYNDGATLNAAFVLPQDFIRPTAMAERPSGASPNTATFIDIDLNSIDRVPSIPKQQWNQIAVWNGDNISMPGALVDTDIRIDYDAFLVDFLDTGDVTTATGFTPWFEQPVPIMRALYPLAYYISAEIEAARGNTAAAAAYTALRRAGAMEAIIGKAA